MLLLTISSCHITRGAAACVRQIGIAGARFERGIWHQGEESEDSLSRRVFDGRIATAFASWLLFIMAIVPLLGCSPEAKWQRINSIIGCKSSQIQQVVLLPMETHAPLVENPLTINDRREIEAIAQALNDASKLFPNHPAIEWEVKVEMRTEKTKVSFVVMHTEDEKNGTFVSILSDTTSGWNYGDFRSDSLGPLLERLAGTETGAEPNGDDNEESRQSTGDARNEVIPLIAGLVFASVFALLSVIHLKWPHKVKQRTDAMARQFGTLRYTSAFGESYYRFVGGVFCVCAVAMLLGALVLALLGLGVNS